MMPDRCPQASRRTSGPRRSMEKMAGNTDRQDADALKSENVRLQVSTCRRCRCTSYNTRSIRGEYQGVSEYLTTVFHAISRSERPHCESSPLAIRRIARGQEPKNSLVQTMSEKVSTSSDPTRLRVPEVLPSWAMLLKRGAKRR